MNPKGHKGFRKNGLSFGLCAALLLSLWFPPTVPAQIEINLPSEFSNELFTAALLTQTLSLSDSFEGGQGRDKEKIILEIEKLTFRAVRILDGAQNWRTRDSMAQIGVRAAHAFRAGLRAREEKTRISSANSLYRIGMALEKGLARNSQKFSDKALASLSLLSGVHTELCRQLKNGGREQERALKPWGRILSILAEETFKRESSEVIQYSQEQIAVSISVSVLELKNMLEYRQSDTTSKVAMRELQKIMPLIEKVATHSLDGPKSDFFRNMMGWPVKNTEATLLRLAERETQSSLGHQATRTLRYTRRAAASF